MKNLIFTTILILTMSVLGYAQSVFPELDKAKEIKLLQSNRKDVKKILSKFKYDKDDYDNYSQFFSTKDVQIEVTFSDGESCTEEDSEKIWDVGEWKVTLIEIYVKKTLRIEDLGVNSANYRKEQFYADNEDVFVYYNKDLGISFEVDEDEIEKILLYPPSGTQSLLCDNEEAKNYKAFYTHESYFFEPDLEKRVEKVSDCGTPSVTSLTLNVNEIIIGCSNSEESKSCSDSSREISVKTVGNDADNDPITFMYQVSGGKIEGKGAEVIWDLTGVEPGTYTITAGVNDGCGICGETKTQTVIVKECNDCVKKKPQTDAEKQTTESKKP